MGMVDPVSCPHHVAVQLAGRSWIARRQVGGPLTVHVLLAGALETLRGIAALPEYPYDPT